ncbi:MAG: hypothetical protein ABSC19_08575 [Syntrophorhabdales bacterium]|jgi:hypothetical protein
MTQKLPVFFVGFCCLLFMLAGPAVAQTTTTIDTLENQIRDLQKQLDALKTAPPPQTAPAATNAPSQTPSSPGSGRTVFTTTDVKVTLGGFIEAAAIYRNLYTGSDVNSKWNLGGGGFPLRNSPNYYMDEFRETARQSRLSLLAQGQDDYASLAAYFELDFLGEGTSGNSQESNSYSPRIRQLYTTYDACGWHLLAGQSWSLITMDKTGIVPRQENIPLTIDAQYVPGFTWTRNPQVRLVRDFGSMVSVGLSAEAPQAIITGGGLKSGSSVNYTYQLANKNDYAYVTDTTTNSNMPGSLSLDQYPDIVGKVAIDPGFGHYEVYGLGRFFTDRTLVAGSRDNNTAVGWGAGGAVLVPVAPKLVDFQGSLLAGQGIGRYGSAGFSDAVVNPITGKLDPIHEVEVLLGLVAHPTDRFDLYGYAGMEKVSKQAVLSTFGGFGNPNYASSLLNQEGSTASTSNVEASGVQQATIGAWYSFYKGRFGLLRVGLSDSYSHLRIFGGPRNENMNVVMSSLRYYPF